MKNNITELVFIIDSSGSMSGMETDTIGGFNAMIEKQKAQDGKVYVSTVLFDTKTNVLHDRVSIDRIKPLTMRDYCVGGCTALLDAVGGAIKHIANVHKYARAEDVPEHTMFVITTDGMENASHLYDRERVKRMISHEQEKYGWEFLFVAANIDAVETAVNIGIRPERAVDYRPSPCGTRSVYAAMSSAVTNFRNCEDIGEDWKCELDNSGN